MLPAKNRVKKEAFPNIVKNGKLFSGNFFYSRCLDRGDKGPNLFSFVVPSKAVKTSVGRHQLKRQASAVIEDVYARFAKQGFSIIIFAKNGISKKSYSQIQKDILDLVGFLGYTH